ncbi:DUF1822 family protein [Leptolyngbyaceae cyanobacterium UHCC 1019]
MLTLDDMITLYPDQLWLEIPPKICQTARQTVNAQAYSNPLAVERAYQNIICQTVVANWLREDPDLPSPISWLSPQEQSEIWEFVNGSILLLNTTRLALIPSDVINLDELIVEQEWVDIPDWASHYYLAVQLNLQDGWLRVSGYTTHNKLKQQSSYDAMDRTYNLDQSELIEDLTVLWVARETSRWFPTVAPVSVLSSTQAETLISPLSQSRSTSPRLNLPPEQWIALIATPAWRETLYHHRTATTHLGQWFQNLIEPGWQAIRDFAVLQSQFPTYALARGMTSQEKRIDRGDYQLAVMVICEDFESNLDLENTAQSLVEVGFMVGVQVVQSDFDRSQVHLPIDINVELAFPDEVGQIETITERLTSDTPNLAVWFPKLIVQSQEVVRLMLIEGDWQFVHNFTL